MSAPDHAQVLTHCAAIMEVPAIAEQDNFFQLGGDSFTAIRIGDFLAREYRLGDIPLELVLDSATFGDMLSALERRRDA